MFLSLFDVSLIPTPEMRFFEDKRIPFDLYFFGFIHSDLMLARQNIQMCYHFFNPFIKCVQGRVLFTRVIMEGCAFQDVMAFIVNVFQVLWGQDVKVCHSS